MRTAENQRPEQGFWFCSSNATYMQTINKSIRRVVVFIILLLRNMYLIVTGIVVRNRYGVDTSV